jgi:UDP-N-acetylglucosamine:LPS N-acetylglucosamine transferase
MKLKVIAVASGGGHWKELMLIQEAFQGQDINCITTIKGLPEAYGYNKSNIVVDGNKTQPIKLVISLFQIMRIIYQLKPDVIITTGAAIGVFSLAFGKLMRAKTIWLDSLANVEELSLSGKIVLYFSDYVLTQWKGVAEKNNKILYRGSII